MKTTAVKLASTKTELESQLERLKNGPGVAQVQTLREQLRDVQAQATALSEENLRLKTRLAMGRSGTTEPLRIDLAPEPRSHAATTPRADATRPDAASAANANPPAAPALRAPASSVNATLVANAPGSPPPSGQPRLHTVGGGDTLSKISTLYYGTPSRWGDILAANRDILGESNNLIIGRTLRIP